MIRSTRSTPRPLNTLAFDVQVWIALAAGVVVWMGLAALFHASPRLEWVARDPLRYFKLAVLIPIAEEIVFRGGIQPALLRTRVGVRRVLGCSVANLATSALFALAHLPFHPPLWALATFAPSLVFGHLRERYASVIPAVLLHVFYNAGYFAL